DGDDRLPLHGKGDQRHQYGRCEPADTGHVVVTSGAFYTARFMRRLAILFLLSACTTGSTQQKFDPALLRQIDARIEQAIADHKIPGGVYHLEQNGNIYENVYGNRALVPAVEPMTVDTIFDAASITKVVATTPAIWMLIQRGKIGLDDPAQ